MKNRNVVMHWMEGRPGNSGNHSLRTDGKSLWSYRLEIGRTTKEGKKVAIDYMASGGAPVSTTTSRHVSMAKALAHKVEDPPKEEAMMAQIREEVRGAQNGTRGPGIDY